MLVDTRRTLNFSEVRRRTSQGDVSRDSLGCGLVLLVDTRQKISHAAFFEMLRRECILRVEGTEYWVYYKVLS